VDIIVTVTAHDKAAGLLDGGRVLLWLAPINPCEVWERLYEFVSGLVVLRPREVVVVVVGAHLRVVVGCLQELREHRRDRLNGQASELR